MIIQMIEQDQLKQVILPKIKQGIYYLNDLEIKTKDDLWFIEKESKTYCLLNQDDNVTILQEDTFLYVLNKVSNKKAILFVYNEHLDYECYKMSQNEIIVGRSLDCDIIYQKEYISNYHLKISYDKVWEVVDLNSRNGVFVDGLKVQKQSGFKLIIDLFALRMIVVDDVLFIRKNEQITIKKLKCIESEYPQEIMTVKYVRKIRMYHEIKPLIIHLETIQLTPLMQTSPMMMILPAMMMLVTSFCSMFLYQTSSKHVLLMIITMISMFIASILLPFINYYLEKRRHHKQQQQLINHYQQYIQQLQQQINQAMKEQKKHNQQNFCSIKQLQQIVTNKEELLFAKRIFHDDFMVVALGKGSIQAKCEIIYQAKNSCEIKDELSDTINTFINQKMILQNVFVTCDLKKYHVISVYGEQYLIMMEYILMQLCIYHGSDELNIMLMNHDLNKIYLRFIPHLYQNYKRYYLEDGDDFKLFYKQLFENKDQYQVLIVFDYVYYRQILKITKLLMIEKLVIILGCEKYEDVASESDMMIQASNYGKMIDKQGISSYFEIDKTNYDLAKMIKEIASCSSLIKQVRLKTNLSFYELYQINHIKQYNILQHYFFERPYHSLKVKIGEDEHGCVYLDLHEKKHGPHGLIAGMTGSGKSEFIITYLLSLCIHYHPEDVSFCIIDYKGGGLADHFYYQNHKIAHLVGVITNLDKKEIVRSLKSLQGELERRQYLLKQARTLLNDSNIDIYKYQQYYHQNRLKEPLSHLFLVVDEFAQLKQDQKDFMDQLIAIARIGRSLGIHLILATQKPYGVVDEQILSNTNFRICLKVAQEHDSLDMLQVKDGAYLEHSGRFYLKVGNDPNLIYAQSAYANALINQKQPTLTLIEANQQQSMTLKKESTNSKSELQEIMEHLIHIQNQLTIKTHDIYLPPLNEQLTIKDYQRIYPNLKQQVLIGEIDDPIHQLKYGFYYKYQSIIIYGSKNSHKNEFIETIITNIKHCDIHVIDLLNELNNLNEYGYIDTYLTLQDTIWIKMLLNKLTQSTFMQKQIIVIHEYNLFKQCFSDYEQVIIELLMQSSIKNIVFIITSSNSNLNYQISSQIKDKYCLYFEDVMDYHMIYSDFKDLLLVNQNRCGYMKGDDYYLFQVAKSTIKKQHKTRKPLVYSINYQDINNQDMILLGYDLYFNEVRWNQIKESLIIICNEPLKYQDYFKYLNQYQKVSIISSYEMKYFDERNTYLWIGEGYQNQYLIPYIINKSEMFEKMAYIIRNQKVIEIRLVGD